MTATMSPAAPVDERDEWLAWRRQGVGGSDVGSILGISPFGSPFSVWATKVGLIPEEDASEVMEFGKWAELMIAPWFQAKTGLYVRAEQEQREWPDNPVHRCTIDGEVGEGPDFTVPLGGLQMKAHGPGRPLDELPVHEQAQGQWEMHVNGWDREWFAVLMGRRLDPVVLDRDDADIAAIVRRVDDFWAEYVLPGKPPPADGSDATARALFHIYPKHVAHKAVAIDDLAEVVAAWRQAKAAVKTNEALESQYGNQIREALGDAEEGTVDGRVAVTWKGHTQTGFDVKAHRAECPDCARRFETKTPVRTLLAKGPKP